MADTTNYFFNLPTVGGSSGSWGGSLNENWTKLDNLLYGASYTDGDSNTVEKIRPDLLGGSWAIDGTAVTSTAAELNILDGVTATTAELNYVDGVTSAVQTQIDSKAATAGSSSQAFSASTLNATTVDLGDWTITQSGSDLKFAYQGTDRFKLSSAGALEVEGDVTANGAA